MSSTAGSAAFPELRVMVCAWPGTVNAAAPLSDRRAEERRFGPSRSAGLGHFFLWREAHTPEQLMQRSLLR